MAEIVGEERSTIGGKEPRGGPAGSSPASTLTDRVVRPPNRAVQGKYWCFTLNNYTELEVQKLTALSYPDEIKYIVFGKEVGESGTPHLQGYVEFGKRVRYERVRDIVGLRAYVARRIGTGLQASNYCKKDDQDAYELGEITVSAQVRALIQGNHLHRVIHQWYTGGYC